MGEKGKEKVNKEQDSANIVGNDVEDALILSLDNRSESWVIDSGASVPTTSNT